MYLSAVPIAIAGTTIRIVTVALVGAAGSTDLALTVYHDYSGFVVFVAAVFLMMSAGAALDAVGRKRT